MAVLYLISALGCAFAWNWYSLGLFPFHRRAGIGGSSVLGPMYIAEIAPASWRGRLVGFFQFNVVFGILLAYFSNYLIGLAGFGAAEWRWKLGIPAIPAALFLVMLFGIPRSPRWLVQKERIAEARDGLRVHRRSRITSTSCRTSSSRIDAEHGARREPLFSRKYRFPIFLAVSIGMFNQLSGINAILYYLNDIFADAGFSKVSSDLQAVPIGVTNLLFTMLAMSVIDRIGRKTLLLIGSVGTAICLAGVACDLLTASASGTAGLAAGRLHRLLRVLAGRGDLGLHQRSVPEPRARQRPESGQLHPLDHERADLAGLPDLASYSGAPFVFFSVMMVLQFFVVLFTYPETKGITLEDMQKKLGIPALFSE